MGTPSPPAPASFLIYSYMTAPSAAMSKSPPPLWVSVRLKDIHSYIWVSNELEYGNVGEIEGR
jgi:hypothetical protein